MWTLKRMLKGICNYIFSPLGAFLPVITELEIPILSSTTMEVVNQKMYFKLIVMLASLWQ
jgi:hypothetical protein